MNQRKKTGSDANAGPGNESRYLPIVPRTRPEEETMRCDCMILMEFSLILSTPYIVVNGIIQDGS
jgi:hypothetical protein